MKEIIEFLTASKTQGNFVLFLILIVLIILLVLMLELKKIKNQNIKEELILSIKSYRIIDTVLNHIVARIYFIQESDPFNTNQIQSHLESISNYITLLNDVNHYLLLEEHHDTYINLKVDLFELEDQNRYYAQTDFLLDEHMLAFYKTEYKKFTHYKERFGEALEQVRGIQK